MPVTDQLPQLRDVGIVAAFETRRNLGSVRGVLVLLLYLTASLLTGAFYVTVVRSLEEKAVEMLAEQGQAAGARGIVDLSETEAYKKLIESFTDGDPAKMELWTTTPPIVLVSFWLALAFLPFLIMVTAHDVLARDTELRTTRFVRPRTSALSWVLGKFLAQAVLVFLVTVISGVVIYLVAVAKLESFDAVAGALAFANFWGRILVYELGFLGVMFILSGAMRTAFSALMVSGLALFGLWLLQFFTYFKDGDQLRPIGYLAYVSPFTHKDGLWMPLHSGLGQALLAYAAFAVVGILVSVYWLSEREI